MHPSRHLFAHPRVTLLSDLAPELAGVGAAVQPALLQIRHIRIEHTALSPLLGSLGKHRSGGEFADGGPAHPQTTGNLQEWHTLLMQSLDLLIAYQAAVASGLAGGLLAQRRQPQRADHSARRCGRIASRCWIWQARQLGVQAA